MLEILCTQKTHSNSEELLKQAIQIDSKKAIFQNGNSIICLFKVDILQFFMVSEFPAYGTKWIEKGDLFCGNLLSLRLG